MEHLLRLPAVLAASGRRKTAHYQDIKDGLFTRPVAIGRNATAWPESEVSEINAARISGASEAEVRALVKRLEARRARCA